jgi:hypothetical protein
MIKRIVCMEFHPENLSVFEKIMQENIDKIRNVPGCLHLEIWKDASCSFRVFTFSVWQSMEALENYRKSELFEQVWGQTKKLFSAKPMAWSVENYEIPHK